MIKNPSLELKEMKQILHKKFLISYIVKNKYSDTLYDTTYDTIKLYCQSYNLNIICREYDSKNIIEDQENIVSLPAIHLYVENIYSNTYHMKDDFIQSIQNEIKQYEIKQERLKKKKEKWISYFRTIFSFNR